ncbi:MULTISPECIES: hypothetical protein [Myxococcus]|uniref:hypothetical protein n=1 Tax=Myxococcus TaxID=32 RepID=UPI00129CA386|nr:MULTISPECIES: hypothetical protein [Myxococcus]NOK06927.1 hypothetical protein [Myxococcus xanthus]
MSFAPSLTKTRPRPPPLRLRLIYAAAFVWALLPAPLLGHSIAHGLIRAVLP